MVVGLIIITVYQLAQVVTVMEKLAFQQPSKYRQRRWFLCRWFAPQLVLLVLISVHARFLLRLVLCPRKSWAV